jgi:hypothetical protein
MSDPKFDALRGKAQEQIGLKNLPKTIKDVEQVTANVRHRPTFTCAICGGKILDGELWYQVEDSTKNLSRAINRPMHFLCHAAWQCEVAGV